MPLPTVDNSHVAEGLALLTGQFSSDLRTPNIRNLLRVHMRRKQDIENVLWNVINSQLLALSPTGQALNQIGDLIGEPRGSLNDTQYLLWIKIAVAARVSGGRSEDILKICQLAVGLGNFTYTDWYPSKFQVYAPALATGLYAQPFAQALRVARPPGVYAVLEWYDSPTFVQPILSFSDVVSHTGGAGLKDVLSSTGTAVLVSAIQC